MVKPLYGSRGLKRCHFERSTQCEVEKSAHWHALPPAIAAQHALLSFRAKRSPVISSAARSAKSRNLHIRPRHAGSNIARLPPRRQQHTSERTPFRFATLRPLPPFPAWSATTCLRRAPPPSPVRGWTGLSEATADRSHPYLFSSPMVCKSSY